MSWQWLAAFPSSVILQTGKINNHEIRTERGMGKQGGTTSHAQFPYTFYSLQTAQVFRNTPSYKTGITTTLPQHGATIITSHCWGQVIYCPYFSSSFATRTSAGRAMSKTTAKAPPTIKTRITKGEKKFQTHRERTKTLKTHGETHCGDTTTKLNGLSVQTTSRTGPQSGPRALNCRPFPCSLSYERTA